LGKGLRQAKSSSVKSHHTCQIGNPKFDAKDAADGEGHCKPALANFTIDNPSSDNNNNNNDDDREEERGVQMSVDSDRDNNQ